MDTKTQLPKKVVLTREQTRQLFELGMHNNKPKVKKYKMIIKK